MLADLVYYGLLLYSIPPPKHANVDYCAKMSALFIVCHNNTLPNISILPIGTQLNRSYTCALLINKQY